MPFPRFGTDLIMQDKPLFIGETHTDTRSLALLAWKLMWIHDQVHAIFIEHYPSGTGPASASIATIKDEMRSNGMMGGSWLDSRPSLPAEIAQLKYQCDRYRILLRGWDIEYRSNFQRATSSWNRKVAGKIAMDLQRQIARHPRFYIIFGGGAHGDIMKNSGLFKDLPLFKAQGGDFVEVPRLR